MTGGKRRAAEAEILGDLASLALVEEAELEPKPGLVDPSHPGAHDDMDLATLLSSARALRDCFTECASAGAAFHGDDPRALLRALRPIGMRGESAMYAATGGVNTHKGAIFCLGILTAAAAALDGGDAIRRIPREGQRDGECGGGPLGEAALDYTRAMCTGLVSAELGGGSAGALGAPRTAGERLYKAFGSLGARGEAENGFPTLRRRVLPILRSSRGAGPAGRRTARLDALLAAMAELEDSCLLARGGPEALDFVRREAGVVIARGGASTRDGLTALRRLDGALCERRLSPGGAADMLAAGLFLDSLEKLEFESRSSPRGAYAAISR